MSQVGILHITTVDNSGAGRAASRIVCALRNKQVNASLLCLHIKSKSVAVGTIQYTVPPTPLRYRILQFLHLWKPDYKRIEKKLAPYTVIDGGIVPISDLPLEKDVLVTTSDILHLHWVYQFVDIKRFFAKTEQPIVWTLHDMNAFCGVCNYYYYYCRHFEDSCGLCPALSSTDPFDLSHQLWKKKKPIYERNLNRLYIVTPSQWLADCVRRSSLLGKAKIRVIPNCIDTQIYAPVQNYQYSECRPLRIMIGAMDAKDPAKGYDRIERIIPRLTNMLKGRNVEILAVGSNSEHLQFGENISVRSFGFLNSDEEMATVYQQADLLLYTSYRDNLPNMIMEAMACGVPVVAYSVGGIPDLVEHQQTGWLAKTEDDYLQGIIWCLEYHAKLSNAAREKVLKNYSFDVVSQQYAALYNEILQQY